MDAIPSLPVEPPEKVKSESASTKEPSLSSRLDHHAEAI